MTKLDTIKRFYNKLDMIIEVRNEYHKFYLIRSKYFDLENNKSDINLPTMKQIVHILKYGKEINESDINGIKIPVYAQFSSDETWFAYKYIPTKN